MAGAGVARHRLYEVPYMEVTADNLCEVAEWCGGELDDETTPTCVLVPTIDGQMPAFPGWCVVKGQVDFYPRSPALFAAGFEVVTPSLVSGWQAPPGVPA